MSLDHTLTLSSIARRNGVSVPMLRRVFHKLNISPAGRVKNANVYTKEDVKRAEYELAYVAGTQGTRSEGENEINAQTLHKQELLEYLLNNGRQEEYERELEYIRNRRRHANRQRVQRRIARDHDEAVEEPVDQHSLIAD